jgi:hypothetical protein
MPSTITQYRVFIGSPGGLDEERQRFRRALEKCSAHHGIAKDVMFHPVGWEDTIGGVGRPQALINEDLRQCDYAVFVLHDRWGSPTGGGHSSGTAEEWTIAEELFNLAKVRNIAILVFDEVVERLGRKDELAIRYQVATALRFKGDMLADLGRYTDAITCHDEVITRFGTDTDAQLKALVAEASNRKIYVLALAIKRDRDRT